MRGTIPVTFTAPFEHDFYLKGLERSIMVVKSCFETACGAKPSVRSGMHWMLENSEAALRIRSENPSAMIQPEMGEAAGICWRLGNNMTTLMDRKIGFNKHLKMMRHGEAQYGRKDPHGKDFFKDFELELYVAAKLCDNKTRTVDLNKPGHPFDITYHNDLQIECKHPTSGGGIASAITAFGKELASANQKGVMVFAIEDVLELTKMPIVRTPMELTGYVNARCKEALDPLTKGWMQNYNTYPCILGIFMMASAPTYIKEGIPTDFVLQIVNMPGPSRPSGIKAIDMLFREFEAALR